MPTLSRDAAYDYLQLTLEAHAFGFIPATHLYQRLAALVSMAATGDAAAGIAMYLLQQFDADTSLEWDDGEAQGPDNPLEGQRDRDGAGAGARSGEKPQEPDVVHFVPAAPRLADWVFHLGDDDYFPSVPHGHFKGGKYPKLDAYLGWKYKRDEQQGRLPRRDIIDLWNDDSFRDHAALQIDYYLDTHRHYRGWRVRNPRLLPRRRSKR